MYSYAITAAQSGMSSKIKCLATKAREELRQKTIGCFDALIYMARVGCPWRDLPPSFGNWNSVFKRYDHWVKSGVLTRILVQLRRESDFEWAMVDSSVIRAHLSAARAKGGKSIRLWDDPKVASAPKFTLRLTRSEIPFESNSPAAKFMIPDAAKV